MSYFAFVNRIADGLGVELEATNMPGDESRITIAADFDAPLPKRLCAGSWTPSERQAELVFISSASAWEIASNPASVVERLVIVTHDRSTEPYGAPIIWA